MSYEGRTVRLRMVSRYSSGKGQRSHPRYLNSGGNSFSTDRQTSSIYFSACFISRTAMPLATKSFSGGVSASTNMLREESILNSPSGDLNETLLRLIPSSYQKNARTASTRAPIPMITLGKNLTTSLRSLRSYDLDS